MGESNRLRGHAAGANLDMTALLATQIGGGIRFRRKGTVAKAYARLIEDEKSSVVWVQSVDKDGGEVTSYRSNRFKDVDTGTSSALLRQALSDGALVEQKSSKFQMIAAPVRFGTDKSIVGAVVVGWSFADLNEAIAANLAKQVVWAVVISVCADPGHDRCDLAYVRRPR